MNTCHWEVTGSQKHEYVLRIVSSMVGAMVLPKSVFYLHAMIYDIAGHIKWMSEGSLEKRNNYGVSLLLQNMPLT